MQKQEQITRKVKRAGNGAHVFVPKGWAGEEVTLIRQPLPPVEERILNVLKHYLEGIVGIYLYGSYARGEAVKGSDVDILVITNKKINIKEDNYEIVCLTEDEIEKAIKISPVLIYSAMKEARSIVNSKLLEELRKKHPINEKYFKDYLKETKRIIEINEDLLDRYSIVLRLRGIFIIKQLLKEREYSHREFKRWISKNSEVGGNDVLDKKKKLSEKELRSLLSLLKKSVTDLEGKL